MISHQIMARGGARAGVNLNFNGLGSTSVGVYEVGVLMSPRQTVGVWEGWSSSISPLVPLVAESEVMFGGAVEIEACTTLVEERATAEVLIVNRGVLSQRGHW